MSVANEVISKVESYIGIIAEKFNAIAPEVWEILIRQQYLYFYEWLVLFGLSVFLTIIFICCIKKSKWGDSPTRYDICSIIFGLSSFFMWVATMSVFYKTKILVRFLNPEYYAIQEILSNIK